jgi:hypothetical protein
MFFEYTMPLLENYHEIVGFILTGVAILLFSSYGRVSTPTCRLSIRFWLVISLVISVLSLLGFTRLTDFRLSR